MSLVPLCKDLDTYVEIAIALGYDPNASVHLRPVYRPTVNEELSCEPCLQPCSAGASSSTGLRPQLNRSRADVGSAGSSSSTGQAGIGNTRSPGDMPSGGAVSCPTPEDGNQGNARNEASVSDVRLVFAGPHLGSRSLGPHALQNPARPLVVANASGAWRQLGRSWASVSEEPALSTLHTPETATTQPVPLAQSSNIADTAEGCWKRTAVEDFEDALTLSHPGSAQSSAQRKTSGLRSDYCLQPWLQEEENEEVARRGGSSTYYEAPATGEQQPAGSAASSQALVWGVGDDEVEVEEELSVKVKLIYAGGWSDSSGSEGHRTPPTPPPPASSSATNAAAAASARAQQAGGLDADHVEQFTVSFISDVQMHEELEDLSCLCTFCLDDMKVGEELCRLPCMHTFHRRCVHAWLERDRRCMLCRLDITRPRG